eukprot:3404-Prymnesium_polylepis.2
MRALWSSLLCRQTAAHYSSGAGERKVEIDRARLKLRSVTSRHKDPPGKRGGMHGINDCGTRHDANRMATCGVQGCSPARRCGQRVVNQCTTGWRTLAQLNRVADVVIEQGLVAQVDFTTIDTQHTKVCCHVLSKQRALHRHNASTDHNGTALLSTVAQELAA